MPPVSAHKIVVSMATGRCGVNILWTGMRRRGAPHRRDAARADPLGPLVYGRVQREVVGVPLRSPPAPAAGRTARGTAVAEVIRLERGQDPPYGEDYVLVDFSGIGNDVGGTVVVNVKGARFFVPLAGDGSLDAALEQARELAEREDVAAIYVAAGG